MNIRPSSALLDSISEPRKELSAAGFTSRTPSRTPHPLYPSTRLWFGFPGRLSGTLRMKDKSLLSTTRRCPDIRGRGLFTCPNFFITRPRREQTRARCRAVLRPPSGRRRGPSRSLFRWPASDKHQKLGATRVHAHVLNMQRAMVGDSG